MYARLTGAACAEAATLQVHVHVTSGRFRLRVCYAAALLDI